MEEVEAFPKVSEDRDQRCWEETAHAEAVLVDWVTARVVAAVAAVVVVAAVEAVLQFERLLLAAMNAGLV